jgi:hypothetical protein
MPYMKKLASGVFAFDLGQQLDGQGGQHHAGGEVLYQAACLMTRAPQRSEHAAEQGDECGDEHDEKVVCGHNRW